MAVFRFSWGSATAWPSACGCGLDWTPTPCSRPTAGPAIRSRSTRGTGVSSSAPRCGSTVAAGYGGANYQTAIAGFVARLNRAGLVVILDLHWTAADTAKALAQAPMPNRDHTPEFWRQVATAYGHNNAVMFDLFNEPFPDSNADTPEAWRCWRDGGTCRGMSFQAAGMQELVNAVRGTGATNVIMLGGVQYAATVSQWLANEPTDSLNNLAASWHVYNFRWCHVQSCWDGQA